MRKVEQIIEDLKQQLYWSQPNLRFDELMNLVNELENTLFPSEVLVCPEPEVIEEPVVEITPELVEEETVTEEPVVEEVVEEIIIEETEVTEEEPVVEKKSTKKK